MTPQKKVTAAQALLKKAGVDGWLLYDFHHQNRLASHFLDLESAHLTRRLFYWIPEQGSPQKIVHRVETGVMDQWPGEKREYASYEELHYFLGKVLKNKKKIVMEYSPEGANPYVSQVDGGTIDFIRKLGVSVSSSGNILPFFTAVLTSEQLESHEEAAHFLSETVDGIWKEIEKNLKEGKAVTEYEIQQKILERFSRCGFITDSPPICAINEHAADPHFSPKKNQGKALAKGDLLLIDLWCKKSSEKSVFGDITCVASVGKPSIKQKEIFSIVRKAQQAAIDFIRNRLKEGKSIQGWEVDQAARAVIHHAGYGKFFTHRTGHNIEVQLHGSGAQLDNFEMKDERELLASTCFSIEPGIYLPGELGIRLEVDAYLTPQRELKITGKQQNEIKNLSV